MSRIREWALAHGWAPNDTPRTTTAKGVRVWTLYTFFTGFGTCAMLWALVETIL